MIDLLSSPPLLTPINSYLFLSQKFQLPVRIDLNIKIDSPAIYLLFGNGHLTFGSGWDDNRTKGDIIVSDFKPNQFNNSIPYNKYFGISIIYHEKFMQIVIDGEERYFSKKEKYMKSPLLQELNNDGFEFKVTCAKRSNLFIKSLSISNNIDEPIKAFSVSADKEPDNTAPPGKPNFDSCISLLNDDLKQEVKKTNDFLLSLHPMKFKRQIDKYGRKITYLASKHGFSYSLNISDDIVEHLLWWYILTGSKPELWHRKNDMMLPTLDKLAEESPEFANQMFFQLNECVNCTASCRVKTPYEFKGKKKITCHGKIAFKMTPDDFVSARRMISAVNSLAAGKT